ncbi:glucose-6-phosphate dehydrogenase assembly protein OpcA [Deinobacterium chartae]|uniref:Glucose-6-phosphate dehydrogenase assembly protein OpcA n=1 Tax=Deinobacterium chartae TaxID=521158 RepID=A0A841I5P8_9DEIO|nr:glucose-6-phosphate dehydrogenase assembly protein OpcA [Deinobacterium chartae]MBB6099195.1 glucose-6-phosphate dehydrogenase assembly protein OpcA [Deinobacterium chartae]
MPNERKTLGPERSDPRRAAKTLEGLWQQAGVELRIRTGTIVAVTTQPFAERVSAALARLSGRHAGRQILAVIAPDGDLEMDVSLLPQKNRYVERFDLRGTPRQLQGTILPLLSGPLTHVWWACDDPPRGPLFDALAELADQVIADALTLEMRPDRRFALADLSWAHTAPWRELTATLFDAPDAARELGNLEGATVEYADGKRGPLAARLYAGWLASRLGWKDASRIKIRAAKHPTRPHGEIVAVNLRSEDARFRIEALEGHCATASAELPGTPARSQTVILNAWDLPELLGYVMDAPEQNRIFEEALSVARRQA